MEEEVCTIGWMNSNTKPRVCFIKKGFDLHPACKDQATQPDLRTWKNWNVSLPKGHKSGRVAQHYPIVPFNILKNLIKSICYGIVSSNSDFFSFLNFSKLIYSRKHIYMVMLDTSNRVYVRVQLYIYKDMKKTHYSHYFIILSLTS
jgi:hypothetical protein